MCQSICKCTVTRISTTLLRAPKIVVLMFAYSLDCMVLVFVQVNSARWAARSVRSVIRVARQLPSEICREPTSEYVESRPRPKNYLVITPSSQNLEGPPVKFTFSACCQVLVVLDFWGFLLSLDIALS